MKFVKKTDPEVDKTFTVEMTTSELLAILSLTGSIGGTVPGTIREITDPMYMTLDEELNSEGDIELTRPLQSQTATENWINLPAFTKARKLLNR